jgi:hypothetical protein
MDFTKVTSSEKELSTLADNIKADVQTMIIAKVVKVYTETQRVDVQPCITIKVEDPDGVKEVYTRTGKKVKVSELEMPVILNVPLSHPRSGNFMITLPVAVDCYGMLFFSSQDINVWKAKGGTGIEQKNLAQFDINDAVFLPYVASDSDVVSDYNADALEVRAGDDKLTMAGDGKVSTNCDIEINGISFLAHVHSYTAPLHPSPTPGETGVPE